MLHYSFDRYLHFQTAGEAGFCWFAAEDAGTKPVPFVRRRGRFSVGSCARLVAICNDWRCKVCNRMFTMCPFPANEVGSIGSYAKLIKR